MANRSRNEKYASTTVSQNGMYVCFTNHNHCDICLLAAVYFPTQRNEFVWPEFCFICVFVCSEYGWLQREKNSLLCCDTKLVQTKYRSPYFVYNNNGCIFILKKFQELIVVFGWLQLTLFTPTISWGKTYF